VYTAEHIKIQNQKTAQKCAVSKTILHILRILALIIITKQLDMSLVRERDDGSVSTATTPDVVEM